MYPTCAIPGEDLREQEELQELAYGEPFGESAEFVFLDPPYNVQPSGDDKNLEDDRLSAACRRNKSNDTAAWG